MTFKGYLLTKQTNIRGERSHPATLHVGNLFCELSINLVAADVVSDCCQA